MAKITEVTQTVTHLHYLRLLTMAQHSKQNRTLTSLCVYSVPPEEGKEEVLAPSVVISIHS